MSLFLFSTFPKFVDEELNRRRKAVQNGEPAYIQKPKSPWMRMVSGFKPEGGSRKALMGGDLDIGEKMKFGFENLYETQARDGSGGTTGERYRPKPTITSISVDEKLQSFECTVEWKANSIGQLERLFPHFMGAWHLSYRRLGMVRRAARRHNQCNRQTKFPKNVQAAFRR